jgi:LDH2 family malate/lactate/ureidoglycolate dehydrogenase
VALISIRAVLLDPSDDVAAVLDELPVEGTASVVSSATGETLRLVKARSAIPFGHKIAIGSIPSGSKIKRYGYPIGVATQDIQEGEHVHAHNMRSLLSPALAGKADERVVRTAEWVRHAVTTCLHAVGARPEAAAIMAEVLTEAHLRGVETHGLRRLRPYINRIKSGGVDAKADIEPTRHGSLIKVDGRNGIGHFIAAHTADLVSEQARRHGIAIGLVRNSNHFGFAGYYATRIAAARQIGIVTSNGQVCVAPAGAKRALLSNNPLAIAAPTGREDAFVELDLATSVTSRANIVEAARSGRPLPTGWAQDFDGQGTRDPGAALAGSLLSFGGDKGFALLFALEAITGVLDGGAYADQVSSKEAAPNAPEGTAHTLIAIDLQAALGADVFEKRMDDLIGRLFALPSNASAGTIRYPGQRRWRLRMSRLREGIPLAAADFKDVCDLAGDLGVTVGRD